MYRPTLAFSIAGLLLMGCSGDGGPKTKKSADLKKSCALVSACSDGAEVTSGFAYTCEYLELSDAARAFQGTYDKLALGVVNCMLAAKDCADIHACTKATSSEAAVCSGDENRCAGDVLVECDGSKTPDAFDCAAAGLICGNTDNGAECGESHCTKDTPDRCDGSLMVTCARDSVLDVSDCRGAMRWHCQNGACQGHVGDACVVENGEATCVGTGAVCDESTFQNRCDGSTMVTCTGGKEGRRDCASLDPRLTCKLGAFGVKCDFAATQCTPDMAETCTAGVVGYCSFGTPATVDCKAMGLSGCTTFQASGQTYARCTR